jgi:hypothetical protein
MIVKKRAPTHNSQGFSGAGTGSETHDPNLKNESTKI